MWSALGLGWRGLEGSSRAVANTGLSLKWVATDYIWQCGNETHKYHIWCSLFLCLVIDLSILLGFVLLAGFSYQCRKDLYMEDFGLSLALCILPNQPCPTKGIELSLTLGTWWRNTPFFRHVEITVLSARLGHTAGIAVLQNGTICPGTQSQLEAGCELAHSYLDFHLGALALRSSWSSGRRCWANGVISPCILPPILISRYLLKAREITGLGAEGTKR